MRPTRFGKASADDSTGSLSEVFRYFSTKQWNYPGKKFTLKYTLQQLLFKDDIKVCNKNNAKIKTSFLAKTSVSATG